MTALCLATMAVVAGCGGGSTPAPGPGPDDPGDAGTVQVGPLQIRTASTAGFTAQSIPTPSGACAFVALSGAQITWMGSQALMDRLLYTSTQGGDTEIWVSNLDGSGATQLTNNTAFDTEPEWSPDGRRILFVRKWSGQDAEIMVMNADGSGVTQLTSNIYDEGTPTWSPDGQMIAFHRQLGNSEIFTAEAHGGGNQINISNNVAIDQNPDWSPSTAGAAIAFSSGRDGQGEIYRMRPNGTGVVRVTFDGATTALANILPAWNSAGTEIAYTHARNFGDIRILAAIAQPGGETRSLMLGYGAKQGSAWSRDDALVAISTNRDDPLGSRQIWLQQTTAPHRAFRVTSGAWTYSDPDLGSPVMQTDRVLVGPNGSDWGGTNPVFRTADAGIVAFAGDGYRNFVRIGVHTQDLPTLRLKPLTDTGGELVGVVARATRIANLREDAGRGAEPTVWQLDALNAGAAVLYFHSNTGKLVAVLPVRDVVSPTADGDLRDPVGQRVEGNRLIVEGDFAAVFDAQGQRIASGAAAVALSADGGVSVVR